MDGEHLRRGHELMERTATSRPEESEDDRLAHAERQVSRFLAEPDQGIESARSAIAALGDLRSDARAEYLLLLIDPAQEMPGAIKQAATDALVRMRHPFAVGLASALPEPPRPRAGIGWRNWTAFGVSLTVLVLSFLLEYLRLALSHGVMSSHDAPASAVDRFSIAMIVQTVWAAGLLTLLASGRGVGVVLAQLMFVFGAIGEMSIVAMNGGAPLAAVGLGLTLLAWGLSTSKPGAAD
jgi:hypothetical protein